MFVDASAIVAILALEPGHEEIAGKLHAAPRAITSPLAVYEAVTAIAREKRMDVTAVLNIVERFLERSAIELVRLDRESARLALEAFARYGKGRGHPARLNLGDCFAYAAAKQHGVALLYKGDDFARTDLA